MGVKLKNSLSTALTFSAGNKLGTLKCLGSGSPFNVEEGNSSFLLNIGIGNDKRVILVDCGPMVYSTLSRSGEISSIDVIIVTSYSEYSLGSLNTLVSHLKHIHPNRKVDILCSDHVREHIKAYLDMGGADDSVVNVSSSYDKVNIQFFETSNSSSAFILTTNGNPPIHIIHSGRINVPVFPKFGNELYGIRSDPSNVVVLHEASTGTDGACNYEDLSEWSNVFKNFFVFGHDKEEGAMITFNERYIRSLSTNDGQNEFSIEKTATI